MGGIGSRAVIVGHGLRVARWLPLFAGGHHHTKPGGFGFRLGIGVGGLRIGGRVVGSVHVAGVSWAGTGAE